MKAAVEEAMTAYFSTPQLQTIRKLFEEADKKEDELEKKLEDREIAIATPVPAPTIAAPTAPTTAPATPTTAPASNSWGYDYSIDYEVALHQLEREYESLRLYEAQLDSYYHDLLLREAALNEGIIAHNDETLRRLHHYSVQEHVIPVAVEHYSMQEHVPMAVEHYLGHHTGHHDPTAV